MGMFRRPIGRNTPLWHQHVDCMETGEYVKAGSALRLAMATGPAGLTGPVTPAGMPYQGMDPSDPLTYCRPYRPVPGMIAYLNFDGAQPNQTQTTGGRQGQPPIGRRRG